MLLFPLFYLPPLPYMALLCAAGGAEIEAHENYRKSTFRNRCTIAGSNGSIDMSIPIRGGRDHHHRYSDSQIDYTNHWRHRHRISIQSCYGSAPYFEHYMPHLEPFYEKQYMGLFDLNKDLLMLIIRLMKLRVEIGFTASYEERPAGKSDLRMAFRPGRVTGDILAGNEIWRIREVPYIKVFDTPLPCPSDISCLDLLFNAGPESGDILSQMVVKEQTNLPH